MRPRTASASPCSILPFPTARSSCFSILPIPPSSLSCDTSRTTTSHPAWAQIWVMPCPISPQPSTPILLISTRSAPNRRCQVSRPRSLLGLELERGAPSGARLAHHRGDEPHRHPSPLDHESRRHRH